MPPARLCAQQRVHNWSFDAAIFFLAQLKGYRVAEIPVSWRNGRGTKVRLWKDAAASFLGLLKIRANHLAGKYRSRAARQLEFHRMMNQS